MSKRLSSFFAMRPVIWRMAGALLAPAVLAAATVPAHAAEGSGSLPLHSLIVEQAKDDMLVYYSNHDQQLWVRDGRLDPAAHALLDLVRTAQYDNLDPAALDADALAAAISRAELEGSPAALAAAELALSRTLTAYVAATSAPGSSAMLYEHDVLRPFQSAVHTTMDAAAAAPSLADYVQHMAWMHPLYGQLRERLLAESADASLRQAAVSSLDRVRALPATPWPRYVVIDAASATLWMYEGGQPVDSMKVVVGRPDAQTPLMAGYIRYATLNPYWNVPTDLVRKTIAKNVLAQGIGYLKSRGYEVVTTYGAEAEVIDPTTVNWKAVRDGTQTLMVRQKPGGTNSMGKVKYEFPNPQGIYLHDTPEKQLMLKDARQLSNGCVRLEDAQRLGRWLFGGAMPQAGADPEQRVDLAEPVPVFITYLTIHPNGEQVAVGSDPYALDASNLAGL